MNVTIVDFGMGNLGSLRRALEKLGASVTIVNDPAGVLGAGRLILPGVGSFADGISTIVERGFDEPIISLADEERTPILGICLGMQLLATKGDEGGTRKGLNIIQGEVKKLVAPNQFERVPHVGWNEIEIAKDSRLYEGIPDCSDFYFTHGYHFIPDDVRHVISRTSYCGSFVSALNRGLVYGVQFHPEKSGPLGSRLLMNFLQHPSTHD